MVDHKNSFPEIDRTLSLLLVVVAAAAVIVVAVVVMPVVVVVHQVLLSPSQDESIKAEVVVLHYLQNQTAPSQSLLHLFACIAAKAAMVVGEEEVAEVE